MFISEEGPMALPTRLQASGAAQPPRATTELPLGHGLLWAGGLSGGLWTGGAICRRRRREWWPVHASYQQAPGICLMSSIPTTRQLSHGSTEEETKGE